MTTPPTKINPNDFLFDLSDLIVVIVDLTTVASRASPASNNSLLN